MNRFLVMFLAPTSVMEEWMKTSPEVKEVEEKKMKDAWNAWTETHAGMIKETTAAGKTKRVTAEGVVDARNDLMLYSIVEAESHEAAAKAFEGHPHFGIPGASIEVMAIRSMTP
jgi:hypothetical protein